MKEYWDTFKGIIERFFEKHTMLVAPVVLIGGFILDTITLNRIDQLFDNLILIAHLLIVGISLLVLYADKKWQNKIGKLLKKGGGYVRAKKIASIMSLFSLGGLFSGFFIFYFRSAHLSQSWPFVILLLLLMLTTEWFKTLYSRPDSQLAVYVLAWASYSIFVVPVLFGKMGAGWFLLSMTFTLLITGGYIFGFSRICKKTFLKNIKTIGLSFLGVFGILFVGYFANIIPPVPLIVKEGISAYEFARVGADYQATVEKPRWIQIRRARSRMEYTGGSITVATSVFAPSRLQTNIYHVWEWKNPGTSKWEQTDRIPLSIIGGRSDGYRGYTRKSAPAAGKWRVYIMTERGQRVGSVKFSLDENFAGEQEVVEF